MLNKDDKNMRFKEFVWWMIFSVPIAGISKESKSARKGEKRAKKRKEDKKEGKRTIQKKHWRQRNRLMHEMLQEDARFD